MKVIIELNENVAISSIIAMDDHIDILIKPDSGNGLVARVNIDDLKLALRKMTAK